MLTLLFGLVAAGVIYGVVYRICTSPVRSLEQSERPELAWLKDEFNLPDSEFKRVAELHDEYLPHCREMCRRVDEQEEKLQMLLGEATEATPDIESVVAEMGRLRSECQQMMLHHFFSVSRTMPPQQGRRYLNWVCKQVFLPSHNMMR